MDPLDAPAAPADDTIPTPDQPAIEPAIAPEPTEPSAAPEPTQATPPEFRQQCADAMGWDTSSFADDAAFKATLSETLDQVRGDRELVALGQEFAPNAQAFREWQQQQIAQEPAAAEPAAEPAAEEVPSFEWPELPELDPRLVQACERDPATNLWRPKEGYPLLPGTAEKLNAIDAQHTDRAKRIVDDFPGLVAEVNAPVIDGLKAELAELKAAFTSSQERLDAQDYMRKRADDLYQHDEQGKQVLNAQTGQPVLSPMGEAQQNAESALRDFDPHDPEQVHSYAEAFVSLQGESGRFESPNGNGAGPVAPPAQPAASPSAQAAAAGQAKQQRFIDRVTTNQHAPDRGGTIPDATAPDGATQHAGADIDACFAEAAREAGVDLTLK